MSSAIQRVSANEKECAIRYENIEKRLDQGQARFARLENMIWGLYVLMITSSIGLLSQLL